MYLTYMEIKGETNENKLGTVPIRRFSGMAGKDHHSEDQKERPAGKSRFPVQIGL